MFLHHLTRINSISTSEIKNMAFSLSHLPSEERIWFMQQVDARFTLRQKLPSWIKNDIIFPPSVNLEQSSSEITAKAKLELIEGKTIWDVTGGFGIDSTIFAQAGLRVTHVEPNSSLQDHFSHNLTLLCPDASVITVNKTCEQFLNESKDLQVDTIYIDPSRRVAYNQKAILLSDYSPNLFDILPDMFAATSNIVIKVSPMLDIHYLMHTLPFIFSISVISVKNECKEVLIKLKRGFSEIPTIITKNYVSDSDVQLFSFEYQPQNVKLDSNPLELAELRKHLDNSSLFLYDVNSSIHKVQAYSIIAQEFNVSPISNLSHIFLSASLIQHFPGRMLKVIDCIPYKRTALEPRLKDSGFNIVPRNFMDSEITIRKKLGIKKNGTRFLYAVRNKEEKPVLFLCEPL